MEYHNEQHRKDIFIEDLVKILPAVAEQSRQKGKNTELPLKSKMSPSLAASAPSSNSQLFC